jgi:phage N-6-adenine-methyltransferase
MMNSAYYNANTSNGEWYTPPEIIERAQFALDGIDLDPYSSEYAQRTVQATHYITADMDAISTDWPIVNTIWANPPHGKGLIDLCINKIILQFERDAFHRGIVLVNNATETAWFQRLLQHSRYICLISKRISFIDGRTQRVVTGNTRGQIALYLSHSDYGSSRFIEAFSPIGACFQQI